MKHMYENASSVPKHHRKQEYPYILHMFLCTDIYLSICLSDCQPNTLLYLMNTEHIVPNPDNKVHGANMGLFGAHERCFLGNVHPTTQ